MLQGILGSEAASPGGKSHFQEGKLLTTHTAEANTVSRSNPHIKPQPLITMMPRQALAHPAEIPMDTLLQHRMPEILMAVPAGINTDPQLQHHMLEMPTAIPAGMLMRRHIGEAMHHLAMTPMHLLAGHHISHHPMVKPHMEAT